MFVDNGFFGFLGLITGSFVVKIFFALFLIFYSIFSLILYRQIQLMAQALHIPLAPLLKAIAIVQIGVALALIFIVIGSF